jgi:lysophospholipase L1-like esterase
MPFFEPPKSAALAPPTPEQRRTADRLGLLCAVSLAALFVIAELSDPGPLVLIAAITFGFAAIAWTVMLHRQWRSGTPALPPLSLIWSAILVGATAAAGGWGIGHAGTLAAAGSVICLGGLLVSYVGLGLAIIRIRVWVRAPTPNPTGFWWWVPNRFRDLAASPILLGTTLVLLLGSTYCGFLALGHASTWALAALLGFGILPGPAVLGLLAEHALGVGALGAGALGWVSAGWGRVVLFGLSAALVLAVLFELTSRTNYPLPAWLGLGALVALVVAIVTGTLADVGAVLLALALMGVAAPTTAGVPDPWPTDHHVLVALGDSYMSGEGAQHFIDGTDTAGVDECRRALTAWPVLVSERKPFDGLAFLACSGAETKNLRTPGRDGFAPESEAQYAREGTQLQTYEKHYASVVGGTPLVVLSLGGNDAGFATIGETCLAPGSCEATVPSALAGTGNLARVANRLAQAYAQVRTTFPTSPVVVIPYPNPIDVTDKTAPCKQAPLSVGDVRFITALVTQLDVTIEKVAAEYGFYVAAPMASALKDQHLQLCDPANHDQPGINFINAQSVGGVSGSRFNPLSWKHGSLHPNERGHAALARAFESWLAGTGHGDESAGLAALQPALERVPVPSVAPHSESYQAIGGNDCATISPDACTSQANDWAANQVGDLARAYFWWLLLLLFGAWWLGFSVSARP